MEVVYGIDKVKKENAAKGKGTWRKGWGHQIDTKSDGWINGRENEVVIQTKVIRGDLNVSCRTY